MFWELAAADLYDDKKYISPPSLYILAATDLSGHCVASLSSSIHS